MAYVQARLYAGDWIADCGRDGCNGAELLINSKTGERLAFFSCSECGFTGDIIWADKEAEIMEVMKFRPIRHTRNWFPKNHPLALKARCPHGQGIAELIFENYEHGCF